MARRPVFVPNLRGFPFVDAVDIEFKWYPGFAKSQTQKSIESLHEAAERQGIGPVLEISRMSKSDLGASLSAFDLLLKSPDGREMSVECAYQGSKVFESGGPYIDLYGVSSRKAKTDSRLKESGEVVAFNFLGKEFPTEPQTAFYDWLYMTALCQKEPSIVKKLRQFRAFSDIFFNPSLSISCQARAAAVFVSLNQLVPCVEDLLCDWDSFKDLVTDEEQPSPTQKNASQLNLPINDVCEPHTPLTPT